jgi:hypothetical protein
MDIVTALARHDRHRTAISFASNFIMTLRQPHRGQKAIWVLNARQLTSLAIVTNDFSNSLMIIIPD